MDFSKFDSRELAEKGAPLELKDPYTKEPILDDKSGAPCIVRVKGTASRSVQAALRSRMQARKAKAKGKKEDEATRVMEDVHHDLCEGAAPFIVGFENISDGKRPLEATKEDIMWFLDLTFPEMGIKKDEDGEPELDAKGEIQFELQNDPFAKQIGEFASKQANFQKAS